MKLVFALGISSIVLLTGCTLNQSQPITRDVFASDITGDQVIETVQIVETDVVIDPTFTTIYPFVFEQLYVYSGDRELLRIEQAGITIEDGTFIPATIPEHAAYGLQFGAEDFMYVIQLDSAGVPVSEPLTINFDQTTQQWQMGN